MGDQTGANEHDPQADARTARTADPHRSKVVEWPEPLRRNPSLAARSVGCIEAWSRDGGLRHSNDVVPIVAGETERGGGIILAVHRRGCPCRRQVFCRYCWSSAHKVHEANHHVLHLSRSSTRVSAAMDWSVLGRSYRWSRLLLVTTSFNRYKNLTCGNNYAIANCDAFYKMVSEEQAVFLPFATAGIHNDLSSDAVPSDCLWPPI